MPICEHQCDQAAAGFDAAQHNRYAGHLAISTPQRRQRKSSGQHPCSRAASYRDSIPYSCWNSCR